MPNSVEVDCTHCGRYITCNDDNDIRDHERSCPDRPVTHGEIETMRKQVAEMHELMTQFATIMTQMQSHPMLAAFMPRG